MHSKISDQISFWYASLKGLEDPQDWDGLFHSDFGWDCIPLDMRIQWSTARQWMLFSWYFRAQWSHGTNRIIEPHWHWTTTLIWEQNIFNRFYLISSHFLEKLNNFKWYWQFIGFVALLFHKWRRACITSQKGTSHQRCHVHWNQWGYSCE